MNLDNLTVLVFSMACVLLLFAVLGIISDEVIPRYRHWRQMRAVRRSIRRIHEHRG